MKFKVQHFEKASAKSGNLYKLDNRKIGNGRISCLTAKQCKHG